MTAYNIQTEDEKGRQIHPVLFNTAKDGSGTWYVLLLDSDGHGQIDIVGALPAGTNAIGKLAANSGVDIGDVDVLTLPQREPFTFRPGCAALASGMVASGTRSGGATVTSTDANTTVWGTEVVCEPRRAGKIDGVSTNGIISGQITIGIKASASTPNGKLTARIRNKDGTWTTCLALTSAFALSTTEIFKTYDIPYLLTTANFNAVPFGFAIGVESDSATNNAIARIMESGFIQGEFEPGT